MILAQYLKRYHAKSDYDISLEDGTEKLDDREREQEVNLTSEPHRLIWQHKARRSMKAAGSNAYTSAKVFNSGA